MPERVSDTRVTGQERAVSETMALLERWVTSAPQRAERVAQAFRDAGLDDSEIAHELRLRVSRPAATGDAVATFDPAVTRAPSPMLRARLAYAGTIRDGTVCWPDLAGMAKAVQRPGLRRTFASMAEHWEGSAPATVPAGRLSVFAYSPSEPDELTLLVWPDAAASVEPAASEEPSVALYAGQSETRFATIVEFLRWAAG